MFDLDSSFSVIDVETTGQSSEKGHIIEIGLVRVEHRKVVRTFHSLIRPPITLPSFISEFTGIKPWDLLEAPTFRDLVPAIREALSNSYFVAHNASFDYSFLKSEFHRIGEHFFMNRFCTVKLSRKFFPGFRRYNLDSMIERMGIPVVRRHRALDDARATAEILLACLKEPSAELVFSTYARSFDRRELWRERLELQITALPSSPGVYLFKDAQDLPLYVGKSTNIRTRILSHLREDQDARKKRLLKFTDHFDYVECPSELEALILESKLIKQFNPPYNVVQRHWRQQVFLKVTGDEYPRLLVTKERRDDGVHYVGPFRSGKFLDYALSRLQRFYRLCPELMKDRTHPKTFCFSYYLKQCSGACGGAVSPTAYRADVCEAVEALSQYAELNTRASVDHFLKTRALKDPSLRRYRDFLADLKSQMTDLPDMFRKRFLIIQSDQDVGYLICEGRLRRVFQGSELENLDAIREFARAQTWSPEAGRETLDEELTVRRYVSMNRHKLQMIGLD